MTDDLKDIEPEIVAKVLEHADDFVDIDTSIDEIIAWGEKELERREEELRSSGGTLQDFKNAASEIEIQVAQKLQQFETQMRDTYKPRNS